MLLLSSMSPFWRVLVDALPPALHCVNACDRTSWSAFTATTVFIGYHSTFTCKCFVCAGNLRYHMPEGLSHHPFPRPSSSGTHRYCPNFRLSHTILPWILIWRNWNSDAGLVLQNQGIGPMQHLIFSFLFVSIYRGNPDLLGIFQAYISAQFSWNAWMMRSDVTCAS